MLGAGGMCLVYEAEHIHLRQAVALKLLKPELARDPTAVARFAQEAQAAAKLRSPNVARVYDVDKLPDGQPYITMELLVGHDLGTELQRRYALPIDLAVDYVRQAANGISEAHTLGIVHRDLKPENLFLTELGEMTERRLLKILDFGIAKNVHNDGSARKLTAPDAVFGTVDYMSPEQIRSASTVDLRTDLWSLGVILFELLTGRTPYNGDARSVIAQIVSDPVVPPSRYVPTLPPGLVAVVMRALAKDPDQRFQSAEDLRRALEPFSEGIEPITEVLARLPPATVPRRNVDMPRAHLTTDGSGALHVRAGTNLAFETGSAKGSWAKRAVAVPLIGAACITALGFVMWKKDMLGARRATTPAPTQQEAPPPQPPTTGDAPPAATTATVIGASNPTDIAPPPGNPPPTVPGEKPSPHGVKTKPKAPPTPPPRASTAAPPPPAPPTHEPAPPSTASALPKHI
jgi:eukaryotic-like serine/threonine-protein kinase